MRGEFETYISTSRLKIHTTKVKFLLVFEVFERTKCIQFMHGSSMLEWVNSQIESNIKYSALGYFNLDTLTKYPFDAYL